MCVYAYAYVYECVCYLQTGLKGGAHQLVMWSAAVQHTQVNIEPKDIEKDRNHH